MILSIKIDLLITLKTQLCNECTLMPQICTQKGQWSDSKPLTENNLTLSDIQMLTLSRSPFDLLST